jgi:uncharacterized membrane protein YhaH (DUF805 family)
MKHPLDVFSWDGKVTRRQYLAAGSVLFAIKYVVDASVSWGFHQEWSPLMYLSPRVSPLFRIREEPAYWLALLAVALPFLAAGLSLSARRLRDMGVKPFWCGLFLFPFLHFAFFLVLAVAPTSSPPKEAPPAVPTDEEPPVFPSLARLVPEGDGARFCLGIVAALAIAALGLAILFVPKADTEGTLLPGDAALALGMFFGLPFGMGFWSAFIVSYRRTSASAGLAIGAGQLSLLAGLAVLIGIAWEGVACIIMAWPILAGSTLIGSVVGHLAAKLPGPAITTAASVLLVILLTAHDRTHPTEAVPLVATTVIRVHAPPEVVWRQVTAVSPIDEPPAPIFAICAMPLASTLEGEGVGARRRCVLTIGDLDETVVTWKPGRELTFVVDRAPERFARYGALQRGQFLLRAEGEDTIVTGTTWYKLRVGPPGYWSLWTQRFVHAVHERVLDHVKRLAETGAPVAASPAALPAWMRLTNETCACTRHARAADRSGP